jgi:uncharacterized protein (UPF0305 family)
MDRDILKNRLRSLIRESIEEIKMHTTMSGSKVPQDCEECYLDLLDRLQDAINFRNQCQRGTADRVHYNGLLGIYRSKIRRHPLHGII